MIELRSRSFALKSKVQRTPVLVPAMCLAGALFAVPPAQGQTYKWIDERGRVHFSDSPPAEPQKNLEEVEVKVNQLKYDPQVHKRRKSQAKLLNVLVEEREAEKKAEQESKKESAKLKSQCDELRAQYQRYKQASAIYRRDKENPAERTFYSDDERASYLEKIQQKIAAKCRD